MMREDWMTLKLNAERDVMLKRMRTSRLIVICAYSLLIFTITAISIFPCFGLSFRRLTNLTDRNKPLLLQSYYFYDTDKSPQFELTYFIQVIALFLSMIMYISIDTLFALVILHVCGQLENFRCRLVNLIASNDFNKALSKNVVTHLRFIRYIDNIEDIFTFVMLASIIYFGIIFCLCGFVLIIMINNENINATSLIRIYYMIAAITSYFMQMFLYCYAGELITEQCESLYYAVYDLKWYKWKSKEAKNLILLMIRCQQPFRITAGKIVPLTMTTFCSLLKTSAGYISFLLAIQD